jgi:hypothetical protein
VDLGTQPGTKSADSGRSWLISRASAPVLACALLGERRHVLVLPRGDGSNASQSLHQRPVFARTEGLIQFGS